jgi:hypothetical protein
MKNNLLNAIFLIISFASLTSYANEEKDTTVSNQLSAVEFVGGLPELTGVPESWDRVVFFGDDTGLVLVTKGVVSNPDSAQAFKTKYVYPDDIRYKISGEDCRALYIHTPIYVSQSAIGPRLISAHKTIISGVCDGSSGVHWKWSNEVSFIIK